MKFPPRRYDDILDAVRPESRRPRMPLLARAAQFAPFAALSGFDGVIDETARLTALQHEHVPGDPIDPDEEDGSLPPLQASF